MSPKVSAGITVGATVVVGAYMVVRAYDLFRTGSVAGSALGAGVLLLVLLGGLLVVGEVRLAAASQRLGSELAAEGSVEPDLPLTASGRVVKEAADAHFSLRQAEVEQAPEDWRAWFRLAVAYDLARDSSRGRRAMRTAVRLRRG